MRGVGPWLSYSLAFVAVVVVVAFVGSVGAVLPRFVV
jgi:hypothetical protein